MVYEFKYEDTLFSKDGSFDGVRGCENKMKNNYKYYNRDTRKYLEFPELDHVIEYAEKYRHAANRDIDVLDKMYLGKPTSLSSVNNLLSIFNIEYIEERISMGEAKVNIIVGGNIGLGKTTVAKMLGDHFGYKVFYENIDSPLLRDFYESSEEEMIEKRIPFLMQLEFLKNTFTNLNNANKLDNAIIDKSAYENLYFVKVNTELGRISETEYSIYKGLLNTMMDIAGNGDVKKPEIMVYLHGSFELMMDRIKLRGREFEQDESLIEYYRLLWEGYDDWVNSYYGSSNILRVNMDEIDLVYNPDDAYELFSSVEKLVKEMVNKIKFG